MTKTNEFKTEMTNVLIPAVKRMIDKEEKYITKLKSSRKKNWFFNNYDIIDECLENANFHLEHLQKRLKEYTEYIK